MVFCENGYIKHTFDIKPTNKSATKKRKKMKQKMHFSA